MTVSEFKANGKTKVVCNPEGERHVFFDSIHGCCGAFLTKKEVEETSTLTGYIEFIQSFVNRYGDRKITSVNLNHNTRDFVIFFDRGQKNG